MRNKETDVFSVEPKFFQKKEKKKKKIKGKTQEGKREQEKILNTALLLSP